MSSKDGFKLHSVFMIVSIISLPCQVREQVALACTWRAAMTRVGYKFHAHTRFCGQMRVNCPRLPLGPRLPTRGRARGAAQLPGFQCIKTGGRSGSRQSCTPRLASQQESCQAQSVDERARGVGAGAESMRAGRSACARNKKKAASPDGKKQ